MKNFTHIFEKIISIDNLLSSWKEFRIGKKSRKDISYFERNLEDNIWTLNDLLKNKTYKHGPYHSFYVHDPKLRHIHKASVRDRVLHHAIVKNIEPAFEPTFIFDSYSCRVGKGAHKGTEQFIRYARKVSKNYTRTCWVLKCDIKKFFASIDHHILLDILYRRINDPDVRHLLKKVIESFSSEFTVNPEEPKGIPIGNLTSQLFANVYLNELDQFMKHELKEKYCLRYADDFVVLHPQREHCEKIIEPISNFLKHNLKLDLHPNKITIRKFAQGVDFLGYICFPHHIAPRLKTEKRIYKKLREKVEMLKNGLITEESFNHSVQSYFGVLSHSNSFKLRQELENQIFFWLTS
ncbi:MAG: reverse transcriptase/maturase family protein [Patescibacteria group bacterium]|nr:reverse transcriptase/maturase family protein [Patescibacteria group bacterium]